MQGGGNGPETIVVRRSIVRMLLDHPKWGIKAKNVRRCIEALKKGLDNHKE